MSTVRMRPRFSINSELPPHEILESLSRFLLEEDSPLLASFAEHHVILKFPVEERHAWSPQLSLTIDLSEDNKSSHIRGLIAPSPAIWTKFIFIFAGLGVISLFAAMWGFAQLSLKQPANALWVLPFTLGGVVLAYLSTKAGQKLAHDEMVVLHDFVDQAIEGAKQYH